MTKPTTAYAKAILHKELEKYAAKDYSALAKIFKSDPVITYDIEDECGLYQVRIELGENDKHEVINILGAIDGPGVRHFLGFVSLVTDQMYVEKAN